MPDTTQQSSRPAPRTRRPRNHRARSSSRTPRLPCPVKGLLAALALGLAACSSGGSTGATTPTAAAPASSTPSVATSSTATPSTATTPSSSSTPVDAGLGAMPSYLPSASGGTMPTGSPSNPALSYPGAPVLVADGDALLKVAVDGPSYPADTKVGAEQVTVTFTLTLTGQKGRTDLSDAHFDLMDHSGGIHKPTLVPGSELPTTVLPGQKSVVKLRATVPSGEGLLRMYLDGTVASAAWDYVAETD